MANDALVSNTYFCDLLASWEQLGRDKACLVEACGVSVAHIERADAQVTLPQFQCIMANAQRYAGVAGFALRVGQQITPNAHGSLGLAFLSSQTVDSALKLLEKYAETQTDLVQFSVQRDNHCTRLVIEESRPLGSAYISVIELALSTVWFALRLLSAGQLTCQQVSLRYPCTEYLAVYREIFGCAIINDSNENALHIPNTALGMRLLLGNPAALQRALSQCEQEMQKHIHQESLAVRIQRRLLRAPGSFPDLPKICAEFALSERTLRRRLEDENTSFQQLLMQTRKQLAERYLQSTQHSVQEIAWLLGYQDPSNFGNAFKRWQGISPSEFRQRHFASPGTPATPE